MPIIVLTTEIDAPIETCFDLSRSIDLHKQSFAHSNETAIAGVTSGLIEAGQSVTWKARHFGFYFSLSSQISAYDRPNHFRDAMQDGPFSRFVHDHFFEFKNSKTRMLDRLDYESPLGPLGSLADKLFLRDYLRNLLLRRNEQIKNAAETNPQAFLS